MLTPYFWSSIYYLFGSLQQNFIVGWFLRAQALELATRVFEFQLEVLAVILQARSLTFLGLVFSAGKMRITITLNVWG